MIRFSVHMHSDFSPDSRTPLDALARQARDLELDRIVLTDHNTAEGAIELATRYPVLAVVGEEVRTPDGDIIGIFLERTIEADLPAEEVLDEIHRQGGVTYIPHPLDPRRSRFTPARLEELAPRIDVIETYNRGCRPDQNQAAAMLATRLGKLTACGSDAHEATQLAHCWMEMPPFAGAHDFLLALRRARHVINVPVPTP